MQNWASNGVIEFDSCDVNTVSGDPSLGILTIDAPGTYRLTFQELAKISLPASTRKYVFGMTKFCSYVSTNLWEDVTSLEEDLFFKALKM